MDRSVSRVLKFIDAEFSNNRKGKSSLLFLAFQWLDGIAHDWSELKAPSFQPPRPGSVTLVFPLDLGGPDGGGGHIGKAGCKSPAGIWGSRLGTQVPVRKDPAQRRCLMQSNSLLAGHSPDAHRNDSDGASGRR
ncbi:hypothetical protein chiPu_0015234 [Chiloscyllium punctatum]|uniref:Uncharacterized protein n=1 Tax=Chiloscyllium punctatum TaxID=137246 RepID=A0A401T260_CHIPU|nr:hypothetical protein [Chiloscyllium punctatum]